MSDVASSHAHKAKYLASIAVKSAAMKRFFLYDQAKLEKVFLLWPEKGLDDLALVLKEEEEMNLQLDVKEARKLTTHKTQFLQQLQRKIDTPNVNPHG